MDYQVSSTQLQDQKAAANVTRTAQVPSSVAVVSPQAQQPTPTDESACASLRLKRSTSTKTRTSSRTMSEASNVACALRYIRTTARTSRIHKEGSTRPTWHDALQKNRGKERRTMLARQGCLLVCR